MELLDDGSESGCGELARAAFAGSSDGFELLDGGSESGCVELSRVAFAGSYDGLESRSLRSSSSA